MLVAPLFFIGNILSSSRYIYQPQSDVLRRDLLRPDINEEIEIFVSPTVKSKSDTIDRPICSHPSCLSKVFTRGLCTKHAYPCSVDGCEKGRSVKGYCLVHSKEHAPRAYKKKISQFKHCRINGCSKKSQAGGYCRSHAKEHAPAAYEKLLQLHNKYRYYCVVEGCDKGPKAVKLRVV